MSSRNLNGGFSDRSAHRHLIAGLTALLLAVALGGCVMTSSPTANPAPRTTEPEPRGPTSNVIHVVPVAGIQGPARLILADAMAAVLRDAGRAAIIAETANDQGPTVRGEVTKARTHGTLLWLSAKWQLLAPYGTAVAEISKEVALDRKVWELAGVEAVNVIVAESSDVVTAMVENHISSAPSVEAMMTVPNTISSGTQLPAPMALKASPPTESPKPMPTSAPRLASGPSTPEVMPRPAEILPSEPLRMEPRDMAARPTKSVDPATSETSVVLSNPIVDDPAALTPSDLAAKPAFPSTGMPSEAVEEMGSQAPTDEIAATPAKGEPMALERNVPDADLEIEPETTKPVAPLGAPMGVSPTASGTTPAPVMWGRPSFVIRGVNGAPGDGNAALAQAIRSSLRARDLTVTEDPRQAGYEILGSVLVAPAINGRQQTRITWLVNTIGGHEVGKAIQENAIAEGSLDRKWGRVAEIVANAAANGIVELFESSETKIGRREKMPDFPEIPDLPRVPGRALPPPRG